MVEYSTIGKSVIRKDVEAKVLGKACYTGDMKFPGLLYGSALRSPYPHARIISIDTEAAKALPGVLTVLTARDIPGVNLFGLAIPDQPVLAADKVRMMGDAVALVAAETPEIAQEALVRIKVEYQELPAYFTPEEALVEGAVPIHHKGNLLQHTLVRKGSVEEGFARADVIVENVYETQRVDHAYIEPRQVGTVLDLPGKIWHDVVG